MRLLLALLMMVSPVMASPLPDEAFVEKVNRLMHWIAERSAFEVPDHQPAFLFVTTETINYAAAGSLYNGQNPIRAAFSRTDRGIMFLPVEGFTDDILVHELVHFMQMTNGRRASCNGDLEKEAYDLQAMFTAETGVGEPVSVATRILATYCPPPWEKRSNP